MQFYTLVGVATLIFLHLGEATQFIRKYIHKGNTTYWLGKQLLEFFIIVGEATLILSESIFTNAILQAGRGGNS